MTEQEDTTDLIDRASPRMTPASPTRGLAEQVADILTEDIVSGRYQPGTKINETRVAERLNVSRGPVRDALTLLERNMLVTIKPRSYTVVNRLTVDELEHLFAFRERVLGVASMYAARNRTETDLSEMKVLLDRLKAVSKKHAAEYSVPALPATQLWDAVIDACHSHIVRQGCLHFTGSNLWANAVERKVTASDVPKLSKSRVTNWSKLFSHIESKDEHAAYEAGTTLVRNNWRFLKPTFAQLFPTS